MCNRHYMRWLKHGDPLHNCHPKRYVPDSPTDLAYLAGLIDGEGYVSFRNATKYPLIKITMCDREVIEWVADILGGRVSVRHFDDPKLKSSYTWGSSNTGHLKALCAALLPYSRIYRKQSELAKIAAL